MIWFTKLRKYRRGRQDIWLNEKTADGHNGEETRSWPVVRWRDDLTKF